MDLLNIVTPCSRFGNLKKISESINIPKENYRWMVVFDSKQIPPDIHIPENCEPHAHFNIKSRVGNAQRNYAISLIKSGHIYFNDDDTTIHPDLWNSIKDLNDDFIYFQQATKKGNLRLSGKRIGVNYTDSHSFIVNSNVIENVRYDLSKYNADGSFALNCSKNAKTIKFIPKILSIYNSLR